MSTEAQVNPKDAYGDGVASVYSYGHKCNCGSLVPANGDDWHRHVTEYGLPALTPAPAQEGNR